MNVDRLLREIEKRLVGLTEDHRTDVLDALREEISRERRRLDPTGTAESERERRVEAETLREVLESINRHTTLEATVAEVLKQLSRVALFDSCALALLENDGRFRIQAVRGFPEPGHVAGLAFRDELSESIREHHWPLTVTDLQEDGRAEPFPGRQRIRSWAGLPLLVEGELVGMLTMGRHRVEAFDEDEMHRAKAVAFSAAAAIRKAQLHEHVRRYAALMERVVAVDHAVFAGEPPDKLAELMAAAAQRIAGCHAALLVVDERKSSRIAGVAGDGFEQLAGKPAPARLRRAEPAELPDEEIAKLEKALGVTIRPRAVLVISLATPDDRVGCLALVCDAGARRDTLLESFASRAAAAYLHALPVR